jgi:hypothetical protein
MTARAGPLAAQNVETRMGRPAFPILAKLLMASVIVSLLGLSAVLAADGAWKFETDKQDQPSLSYLDSDGKTVFWVGCGAHFLMRSVYPGAPKKDDDKAAITLANRTTHMDFAGEIEAYDDLPPHTTGFVQADLGYARDDPELYEKKWHALEARFFDLLDSGQPLTIAAEGHSYALPAIKIIRWRQRFNKIC